MSGGPPPRTMPYTNNKGETMALVGPDSEHYDKRFIWLINGTCEKELLFDGARWSEGPVWFQRRQLPRLERHSQQPHAALDAGRPHRQRQRFPPRFELFQRQHPRPRRAGSSPASTARRRVSRTEPDGSITVIADSYKGKRLNSPNDVVVKSDGTIWFTDPNYGIMSDYEGHKAEQEQDGCYVYRFDPKSGKLDRRRRRFPHAERPRLLAGRDDALCRGVLRAAHWPDAPRHIRAFDVGSDNSLKGGKAALHLQGRHPRWFSRRHRRQHLVERRAGDLCLCARAATFSADQLSAERLQPRLRRAEAEPAVRHLHA